MGCLVNSLHTANTLSGTLIKKKFITCILCIEFVGSVYQGNVIMVESACVCVPVLSAKLVAIHFKRHTILYTYNPATNPNKPTDYYVTLCICRSVIL